MDTNLSSVPLPPSWPDHVKSAFLCALGMPHLGMACVRGWYANSPVTQVGLRADNESLGAEVELLREELRIKDAYRPHQSFGGRTPAEVYEGLEREDQRAGRRSGSQLPSGNQLRLNVSYLEGRKHLPIVELRAAA